MTSRLSALEIDWFMHMTGNYKKTLIEAKKRNKNFIKINGKDLIPSMAITQYFLLLKIKIPQSLSKPD